MQAVFEYKPDFIFHDFSIEKTITVPAEEFEDLLVDPLEGRTFLAEYASLMRQDRIHDVFHCLLVTGEGRTDGLLVESEGYDFARYASYVPEVTALVYPSLAQINRRLTAAVEAVVAEGIQQAKKENWSLSFEELENRTGLCAERNPFLQELLGGMLFDRPEVTDLTMKDGCIEISFDPDFCLTSPKDPETVQKQWP